MGPSPLPFSHSSPTNKKELYHLLHARDGGIERWKQNEQHTVDVRHEGDNGFREQHKTSTSKHITYESTTLPLTDMPTWPE
jgi:hypothetical protein